MPMRCFMEIQWIHVSKWIDILSSSASASSCLRRSHFSAIFIFCSLTPLLLSLLLLCLPFHSTHLNAIILLNYLIRLIVKDEMNKIHIILTHSHMYVLQLNKMILSSVQIKRIEHADEVFWVNTNYEVTELPFTLDFNRTISRSNALKCKYIHAYTYLFTHTHTRKLFGEE